MSYLIYDLFYTCLILLPILTDIEVHACLEHTLLQTKFTQKIMCQKHFETRVSFLQNRRTIAHGHIIFKHNSQGYYKTATRALKYFTEQIYNCSINHKKCTKMFVCPGAHTSRHTNQVYVLIMNHKKTFTTY